MQPPDFGAWQKRTTVRGDRRLRPEILALGLLLGAVMVVGACFWLAALGCLQVHVASPWFVSLALKIVRTLVSFCLK